MPVLPLDWHPQQGTTKNAGRERCKLDDFAINLDNPLTARHGLCHFTLHTLACMQSAGKCWQGSKGHHGVLLSVCPPSFNFGLGQDEVKDDYLGSDNEATGNEPIGVGQDCVKCNLKPIDGNSGQECKGSLTWLKTAGNPSRSQSAQGNIFKENSHSKQNGYKLTFIELPFVYRGYTGTLVPCQQDFKYRSCAEQRLLLHGTIRGFNLSLSNMKY